MNANELMVGDWVLINKSPDNPYYKQFGIEDFETDKYQYCEPIPLTREILEKNGFEKCKIPEIEYIGWRLNEEFSVELNAVDDFDWNEVHIAYVHQLQHALRLCRIDKEIIL